jgi:CCR4-NOT transcriptional regulation complex NOT5 subunit
MEARINHIVELTESLNIKLDHMAHDQLDHIFSILMDMETKLNHIENRLDERIDALDWRVTKLEEVVCKLEN